MATKSCYSFNSSKDSLIYDLIFDILLFFCTGGETRTPDTWFWRPVLYQLSYTRKKKGADKIRATPYIYLSVFLLQDFSNLTSTYCSYHLHGSRNVNQRSLRLVECKSTVIVKLSPGITISTPSGKLIVTCYVSCTYVELWTVVVVEWSVTSTFFFLKI